MRRSQDEHSMKSLDVSTLVNIMALYLKETKDSRYFSILMNLKYFSILMYMKIYYIDDDL